jgi:hypothetical protein
MSLDLDVIAFSRVSLGLVDAIAMLRARRACARRRQLLACLETFPRERGSRRRRRRERVRFSPSTGRRLVRVVRLPRPAA